MAALGALPGVAEEGRGGGVEVLEGGDDVVLEGGDVGGDAVAHRRRGRRHGGARADADGRSTARAQAYEAPFGPTVQPHQISTASSPAVETARIAPPRSSPDVFQRVILVHSTLSAMDGSDDADDDERAGQAMAICGCHVMLLD